MSENLLTPDRSIVDVDLIDDQLWINGIPLDDWDGKNLVIAIRFDNSENPIDTDLASEKEIDELDARFDEILCDDSDAHLICFNIPMIDHANTHEEHTMTLAELMRGIITRSLMFTGDEDGIARHVLGLADYSKDHLPEVKAIVRQVIREFEKEIEAEMAESDSVSA